MHIQMVTALVLQLIQCVVHLPSDKDSDDDDNDRKVRFELLLSLLIHLIQVVIVTFDTFHAEYNY